MANEGVTLKPADWRLDSYDPDVDGVDAITQAGTEVPKAKVDSVKEKAGSEGVDLVEVKQDNK